MEEVYVRDSQIPYLRCGGTEKIKLKGDRADYYFFPHYPILKDGYKSEINKILEEKGWNIGMDIIYKEDIPFSEVIECIMFAEVYRKAYEKIINESLKQINDIQLAVLADQPYTVSEFVELIDKELKELKKATTINSKKELENFLEENGFVLYST